MTPAWWTLSCFGVECGEPRRVLLFIVLPAISCRRVQLRDSTILIFWRLSPDCSVKVAFNTTETDSELAQKLICWADNNFYTAVGCAAFGCFVGRDTLCFTAAVSANAVAVYAIIEEDIFNR